MERVFDRYYLRDQFMRRCKILFLVFIIVSFVSCFKINVPKPYEIIYVKNGDRITAKIETPDFNDKIFKITNILGQTLLRKSKDKVTIEHIEKLFNEVLFAYKLKYKALAWMEILRSGGYTDEVKFNTLYIIRKSDIDYIYFVRKGVRMIAPYIPLSHARFLQR